MYSVSGAIATAGHKQSSMPCICTQMPCMTESKSCYWTRVGDSTWFACRHVLNNRSDLCRARHDSGMRDAEDNELHVPEHFAKVSVLIQV